MIRRRRLSVLVCAGFLVLVATGCDDERVAISRDDLPAVPAQPTETVTLDVDGFTPDTLTITTDDLVEFVVERDEGGLRSEDDRINTGLLFAGESTDITFDSPGRVVLYDLTDEGSTLTVDVTD